MDEVLDRLHRQSTRTLSRYRLPVVPLHLIVYLIVYFVVYFVVYLPC